MDNINYNPTDSGKEPHDPSGKVFKNLQENRGPAALLRQISSQVDNSSNLSKARKWAGIALGCLALVLVIGRWSHQEKAIQNHTDSLLRETKIINNEFQKSVNNTLKALNMTSVVKSLNEVNCREKSGKRKLLERDDGTKVCYLVKKFPSSRKSYERSKTFCKSKGGVLVEIKGPKDQQNVVDMLMEVGSGTAETWLGAYATRMDGNFKWDSDKSPVPRSGSIAGRYANWESNQPNEDGHCLLMESKNWWDRTCGDTKSVVVCMLN